MMQSDSMHAEVVVPWIPRLQYRAKIGNDPDPVVNADAVSPVSSTFSSSLASTAPSTPALSERSPSPNSSLSTYRKYRQKLMASSSSSSSSPSSHHLSHNNNNAAERKPPQKRASSFLNFFIVKEPSQQALEDYQRQLRISGGASSKDRRLDTVGLTGISSAKMPPTVPKVNSKWDGVPHQLIKEKEKQKQKQKRNAHLQSNGPSRSLRSSGSERSGSTTTSSSALSRSSSPHQEPPSSSLAAGQLKSHNSASSTLSDLYGWESGSGSIISISGGATGGGDGNSPEGAKKIKYRSKQKLPRKNASYLQAPPPLPQNVPDQYLEQDLSDLGALLGPPTAQSSSPHPDVDKPSGCPPNSVTQSSTTPCPDEPLDPSFSNKEAFTPRSRPSPLALANHFPSSSSSSSSNNRTIIPKTRTTPSPPPAAPEKNEMMIHPTIIDQAIAPWVHPRYNSPPPAPVYQNQKKKFVRGIFSGK